MKKKRGDSRANSPGVDIDLGDLNKLENELNDLTEDISSKQSKSGLFKSILSGGSFGGSRPDDLESVTNDIPLKVNFDDNLGKATAQSGPDSKTWDGFGKFNNIPINPDKPMAAEPKLSREELLKEKI